MGRASWFSVLKLRECLLAPFKWLWPSKFLTAPKIICLKTEEGGDRQKEISPAPGDKEGKVEARQGLAATATYESLAPPLPQISSFDPFPLKPKVVVVRHSIGSPSPSLAPPIPDLREYPARPTPPGICWVSIPQFEVPEIFGRRRVRRGPVPSGIAIGTTLPRIARPDEQIIPGSLWDTLWEILSPPLRVDELLQRKFVDKLRPFQVEGVKRLVEEKQFILADEMGTGKTVQACVALALLACSGRLRRALIICPKSVLFVWREHLEQWAPGVVISHDVDEDSPNHACLQDSRPRVWIISYGRLSTARAAALGNVSWDLVVLDEVHEIRNPSTRKYKTLENIVKDACYRWGLSGTPLQNRLEELRAIFKIVRPSLQLRAENMSPAEVREAIRPFVRRVRRKDVLPDLPEKERKEIWFELDPDQRRDYSNILAGFRRESQSREVTFTHIWQVLMELKKICNFASNKNTSPKLQKLLELIREIVARGEKVVVFTQFREFGVNRLEPWLRRFGLTVVHGGCMSSERRKAVQRFQQDPTCRVFLATVHSAGCGLTLTAANNVVHFDHWWNPAVAWQAEDRVYRIGQTREVTVYEFWVRNTVEERIRQILEHKGFLHHEVIERLSQKEFRKLFTLEDLMSVLGVDQPRKTRSPRRG